MMSNFDSCGACIEAARAFSVRIVGAADMRIGRFMSFAFAGVAMPLVGNGG